MTGPPTCDDWINAAKLIDVLIENRSLDFKIRFEDLRDTERDKNVDEREMLIAVKLLVLDEAERVLPYQKS